MNENHFPVWPGWETVRLIGRGSFGAVYEIERDVLGEREKAALKVISIPQNESDISEMYSDGYDDESITSTFKEHLKSIVAEYSLMRKLNGSAYVVNCDDVRYVQHDDGVGWDIFIKMELLTPLPSALPADVPEEQVVKIAKDICRALVQCKQFGIIHRDIKPQNIFVSPLGDYKLGDFGIAKTVEKTSGGTKIGTYKYMAPEVYNNQPYGAGADIYSLGLVLYWLLNERRLPFLPLPPEKLRAGMEEEARQRRFNGEAIPAPAHGSEELQRIVLKACAFDPKDRFQSAEEMLRDLVKLSGEAVFSILMEPIKTVTTPSGDEDGTVGAFGAKKTKPTVDQQEATESAFKQTHREEEEELTVSAFAGGTPTQKTAKPAKKSTGGLIVGAVMVLAMLIIGTIMIHNAKAAETSSNDNKDALAYLSYVDVQGTDNATTSSDTDTELASNQTQTAQLDTALVSAKLTMGTGGESGTYFSFGNALGRYIGSRTKININVLASNGSTANLTGVVMDGSYDLAIVPSDIIAYAYNGMNSYVGNKMDGFRALGGLYAETIQIISCNPEIKTVADLVGKSVCVGDVGSSTYFSMVDILAAYDMTLNDIKPFYQSFGNSMEDLKAGRIDAAIITSGLPTFGVTDLSNSTNTYLIPIDEEHMIKLLSKCPWYASFTIPAGTYSGINQDTVTVTLTAVLICRADIEDDVAYAIVSTIYNNTSEIAAMHAKGAELSVDFAVDGIAVPFANGAALYYGENGIRVDTAD